MGPNILPNQGLKISQKPSVLRLSVETCGYYKFCNFLLHVLYALSRYNLKNKTKLMKEYSIVRLVLALPIQPN